MKYVSCKGYIIPGMDFESGYSIWFLRWIENPTDSKQLSEVWCFHPDGKRVCYIDPKEEVDFFRKYHSFDEVIGTEIGVKEGAGGISIDIDKELQITIKTGFSLLYSLINLILSERHKIVGKTETGKLTENIPHKMIRIADARALLGFRNLGKLNKNNREILVGDGKSHKKPIVSYCTLRMEE